MSVTIKLPIVIIRKLQKSLKKENTSVSNAANKKWDFIEFILNRLG